MKKTKKTCGEKRTVVLNALFAFVRFSGRVARSARGLGGLGVPSWPCRCGSRSPSDRYHNNHRSTSKQWPAKSSVKGEKESSRGGIQSRLKSRLLEFRSNQNLTNASGKNLQTKNPPTRLQKQSNQKTHHRAF